MFTFCDILHEAKQKLECAQYGLESSYNTAIFRIFCILFSFAFLSNTQFISLFSNHSEMKREQITFTLDIMNADKNQEWASRSLIARLSTLSVKEREHRKRKTKETKTFGNRKECF